MEKERRNNPTAKEILEEFYKRQLADITLVALEELIDWGPNVGSEVQEDN